MLRVCPFPRLSLRSVSGSYIHVTLCRTGLHALSLLCRVSGLFRDVLWERAFETLPAPLVHALRFAELDDPGVLVEYPRLDREELTNLLGDLSGADGQVAPPGAASPSTTPITHGHEVRQQEVEWLDVSSRVVSVSFDSPRKGEAGIPNCLGFSCCSESLFLCLMSCLRKKLLSDLQNVPDGIHGPGVSRRS